LQSRIPWPPQPSFLFTNSPADRRVVNTEVIGDLLLGVSALEVRACYADGVFRVRDDSRERGTACYPLGPGISRVLEIAGACCSMNLSLPR